MKKRYKNVFVGENSIIEDFVILGKPPRGYRDGELKTVIGNNSTIRSGSVIYAGNEIGDNFHCGHSTIIRENNKIGAYVSVGSNSCIEHHNEIQNNVRMHSQVFIPEYSLICEDSWIGPNVVLTNAVYPKSVDVKVNLKGPIIMNDAIIGANSTILPGVVVGRAAIVGAGAVVTKDVNDGDVVVGNPAKRINTRNMIQQYEEGR